MSTEPTPDEIDRAAKWLRETMQAGKGIGSDRGLKPWVDLPKSTKRKWLTLAEGALKAARGDQP